MALRNRRPTATYLNPVYDRSFPDPFVLKYNGEYFAYATGFAEDGTVFPIIRSPDLVNWTGIGGAMQRLPDSPPFYWAPEVTYSNGKFYLYYSAGPETWMDLRVAVSDRPDGGFVDAGRKLSHASFAIDPHVFTDEDGLRWMFYATDFLEHTHIGTGTVVDRMIDWFTLEGDPRPVTRARFDWQVYDPNRTEKGGVRWYTVEGPAVLKRKDRYFEMFSGGNWQNTSYGVSFAVSDRIKSDEEWKQFSDGEKVQPILRTLPELVIGPGHNSVVRGPNNRELYCVYHRWVGDQRVMAIDRMDFAGDRIFVSGPTYTEQPVPFQPAIRERFENPNRSVFESTVGWTQRPGEIVSGPDAVCELSLHNLPQCFVCELWFQMSPEVSADGKFGVSFSSGESSTQSIELDGTTITIISNDQASTIELPEDFLPSAHHHMRIELDCERSTVKLDDQQICCADLLVSPATTLKIWSQKASVAVTSFDLTLGFEDLFDSGGTLAESGWVIDGDSHTLSNGVLLLKPKNRIQLAKGPAMQSFEFAANFRTVDSIFDGHYGVELRSADEVVLRYSVDPANKRLRLDDEAINLPANIELSQYHQMRIIKNSGSALVYFDDVLLGEFPVRESEVTCGIFSDAVPIALEMVRVIGI